MKLLKFYGRTSEGIMAQIRREVGADALIFDTRTVRPGSAVERMNPGAKLEITVALETPEAAVDRGQPAGLGGLSGRRKPKRNRTTSLLHDLGALKAQVRDLLEQSAAPERGIRDNEELADYRLLLERGVESRLLAPAFRRWLNWRTASADSADGPPPLFDPNDRMTGTGFREWLWHEWRLRLARRCGAGILPETGAHPPNGKGPVLVGFAGGHGVGKSTLLAKMASKYRQNEGKRVAVVSLDSGRMGAREQWIRQARLMDLDFFPVASEAELRSCAELFDRFDWIGIDTPGAMQPDSPSGRLYGSLLATCPQLETTLVLDVLHRDRIHRNQIEQMRPFHPERLSFTKLDQTAERGALINLTFDDPAPVFDRAATGDRIPEDLAEVNGETLWQWVFAEQAGENAPVMPAHRSAGVAACKGAVQ